MGLRLRLLLARLVGLGRALMEVVLISYLVAITASFAVGVPILCRSLRDRDKPLALLGAAVALDGFEWLTWTLCVFPLDSLAGLETALALASRLGLIASVLCLIVFTRGVLPGKSGCEDLFAIAHDCVGAGICGKWRDRRLDG